MAKHAEMALIELISGGECLTSAAITQQVAKMKEELAGPSPTLLERMTVQRIVLTWLQLQHCEMQFLQTPTDVQWARYWLARQAQADKLYRAAVRSLGLIRELLPAAPAERATDRANGGEAENGLVYAHLGTPVSAQGDQIGASGKSTPPEGLPVNRGCGLNRIAGLAAPSREDSQDGAANGSGNGTRPINGHANRLSGILTPCATR